MGEDAARRKPPDRWRLRRDSFSPSRSAKEPWRCTDAPAAQLGNHLLVSLFKNVQRQNGPREQDHVGQREQRHRRHLAAAVRIIGPCIRHGGL